MHYFGTITILPCLSHVLSSPQPVGLLPFSPDPELHDHALESELTPGLLEPAGLLEPEVPAGRGLVLEPAPVPSEQKPALRLEVPAGRGLVSEPARPLPSEQKPVLRLVVPAGRGLVSEPAPVPAEQKPVLRLEVPAGRGLVSEPARPLPSEQKPVLRLVVPAGRGLVSEPAPVPAEQKPVQRPAAVLMMPPVSGPPHHLEWFGNPLLEPLLGQNCTDSNA